MPLVNTIQEKETTETYQDIEQDQKDLTVMGMLNSNIEAVTNSVANLAQTSKIRFMGIAQSLADGLRETRSTPLVPQVGKELRNEQRFQTFVPDENSSSGYSLHPRPITKTEQARENNIRNYESTVVKKFDQELQILNNLRQEGQEHVKSTKTKIDDIVYYGSEFIGEAAVRIPASVGGVALGGVGGATLANVLVDGGFIYAQTRPQGPDAAMQMTTDFAKTVGPVELLANTLTFGFTPGVSSTMKQVAGRVLAGAPADATSSLLTVRALALSDGLAKGLSREDAEKQASEVAVKSLAPTLILSLAGNALAVRNQVSKNNKRLKSQNRQNLQFKETNAMTMKQEIALSTEELSEAFGKARPEEGFVPQAKAYRENVNLMNDIEQDILNYNVLFGTKQTNKIITGLTGESRLPMDMTKAQVIDLNTRMIRADSIMLDKTVTNSSIDPKVLKQVLGINNSPAMYKVLGMTELTGLARTIDPQIKSWLYKNLVKQAKTMKNFEGKSPMTTSLKHVSSRHAFSAIESRSGIPLTELAFDYMTEAKMGKIAGQKAFDELQNFLDNKLGKNTYNNFLKRADKKEYIDFMSESESKQTAARDLIRDLPTAQEDFFILNSVKKFLSEVTGKKVMSARGKAYFELKAQATKLEADVIASGSKPSKSNKMMKNKLEQAMSIIKPKDLGADAEAKGFHAYLHGKFDDWVANTETFGIRKDYYMSEALDEDTLVDSVDLVNNFVHMKKKSMTPEQIDKNISELKTRKTKTIDQQGSVMENVHRHTLRIFTEDASGASRRQMQTNLNKAGVDYQSIPELDSWIKTTGGRFVPEESNLITQASSKIKSVFWTSRFASPTSSAILVTRNAMQNLAIAPSQLSVSGMADSTKTILSGKANPYLKEAFLADKANRSQVSAIREVLLNADAVIASTNPIKKAWKTLQKTNYAYTKSDEVNRSVAYVLAHQNGYDALQRYKQHGKFNVLSDELKLSSLNQGQQRELVTDLTRLTASVEKEFLSKYSQYKVLDIHFGYDKAQRSLMEQSTYGKMISGPITYGRGNLEIMGRVGLNLGAAIKSKDLTLGKAAVKSIFGYWLGQELANNFNNLITNTAASSITGKQYEDRDDYGLVKQFFSTGVESPELKIMADTMFSVMQNVNAVNNGDKTYDEALLNVTKNFTKSFTGAHMKEKKSSFKSMQSFKGFDQSF